MTDMQVELDNMLKDPGNRGLKSTNRDVTGNVGEHGKKPDPSPPCFDQFGYGPVFLTKSGQAWGGNDNDAGPSNTTEGGHHQCMEPSLYTIEGATVVGGEGSSTSGKSKETIGAVRIAGKNDAVNTHGVGPYTFSNTKESDPYLLSVPSRKVLPGRTNPLNIGFPPNTRIENIGAEIGLPSSNSSSSIGRTIATATNSSLSIDNASTGSSENADGGTWAGVVAFCKRYGKFIVGGFATIGGVRGTISTNIKRWREGKDLDISGHILAAGALVLGLLGVYHFRGRARRIDREERRRARRAVLIMRYQGRSLEGLRGSQRAATNGRGDELDDGRI